VKQKTYLWRNEKYYKNGTDKYINKTLENMKENNKDYNKDEHKKQFKNKKSKDKSLSSTKKVINVNRENQSKNTKLLMLYSGGLAVSPITLPNAKEIPSILTRS
jgi:hypothetical protein